MDVQEDNEEEMNEDNEKEMEEDNEEELEEDNEEEIDEEMEEENSPFASRVCLCADTELKLARAEAARLPKPSRPVATSRAISRPS